MFGRIILTALAAGLISGVFIWAAHMVKTTPLILAAEVYEDQAAGHQPTPPSPEQTPAAQPEEEWAPADGIERGAFTLLMDALTGIGFAFLLAGAISLRGRPIDWRRGVLWGLSGFAAFFAAPSFGLAPELPGMQAGDLGARQAWWLATAVLTAGGLSLLAFTPRPLMKGLGVVLIVLPHAIGAPAHEIGHGIGAGNVPAEMAAEFAIATLVVTGLFWALLGGLTGYFYNRFERP